MDPSGHPAYKFFDSLPYCPFRSSPVVDSYARRNVHSGSRILKQVDTTTLSGLVFPGGLSSRPQTFCYTAFLWICHHRWAGTPIPPIIDR